MSDENLSPCPFCGSSDVRTGPMYYGDQGELDGVECVSCDAIAPAATWNSRFTPAEPVQATDMERINALEVENAAIRNVAETYYPSDHCYHQGGEGQYCFDCSQEALTQATQNQKVVS